MIIELHRNELDNFRRRARLSKVEILAALLGHKRSPHLLRIENFVYPDPQIATAIAFEADLSSAYMLAELGGVRVLGSIHSHPQSLPVMSPRDYSNHRRDPADEVSGIVGVFAGRTYVLFWRAASSLPCVIRYV